MDTHIPNVPALATQQGMPACDGIVGLPREDQHLPHKQAV